MIRRSAFRWAVRGFALAFRDEPNFRVHLCAAEAVLYLAYAEREGPVAWAALLLAIALVLAFELVNTAVERAVDLTVGETSHPLAAAAKDAAAAAVLVTSVGTAALGIVVLGPRLPLLLTVFRRPGCVVALLALAIAVCLTFWTPTHSHPHGRTTP